MTDRTDVQAAITALTAKAGIADSVSPINLASDQLQVMLDKSFLLDEILDQQHTIYFALSGSDSNAGLNMNSPKRTPQAASTAADALLPAETNQVVIVGLDAGDYTGSLDLSEWVHIDAVNASLDGRLTVSDNTITRFRRLQNSVNTENVIRKQLGTGFAKVEVDLLIVDGADQDGLSVNAGHLHVDAGVMVVDAGIGIKARGGSRVSFIISEIALANGGLGIGTRLTTGAANSYSGNVLYARDDGTGTLFETGVDGDVFNIQGGSFLVDTLYDLGVNSTLSAFATEASGAQIADPTATENLTLAGVSNFNSTTDIIIDRVLEAISLADDQQPTGLGIANALQIEFGAAQFTVSDPVMIDVDGTVTFNTAGMYRVKSVFQFGRTGQSGTSELLFRLLVNDAQQGRSVGVKLGNSDVLQYIDIDNWFNVPAGTTLKTEIMRDNSGHNSGGIFKTVPTDEGAGTWGDVPCTVLRIERWANTP